MIRNLASLSDGETAVISALYSGGELRRRLMDLGFTEGTRVKRLSKSPLGDPVAFLVKGAVIALRREDIESIVVQLER